METRTYRTHWDTGNDIRILVYLIYTLADTSLSFKRYLNTNKGKDAVKQACEQFRGTNVKLYGNYLYLDSTMELEHIPSVWFERVVERPQ